MLRTWLADVSAVVHLAARVHIMNETDADPLREFRAVNVEGSKSVAQAAVAAGVRRFVFISTVKVHGGATFKEPFTEETAADPQDPYAVSKWEAEEALRSIAMESGMELVIVRPPLVYGPGVRGNFLRLMNLIRRGIPLPVPDCANRRSLVGAENLASLLVRCVRHPQAAGQSFLVSDSEDVSTRELLRRLGRAMGCPARFLPIPEAPLRWTAKWMHKQAAASRILDSLVVDSSKARQLLGWAPSLTLDEGVAATARWYQEIQSQAQARSA